MVNFKKNSIYFCILITFQTVQSQRCISFEPWQGRLGDQLWNICKSLLLADKYKLPFICKPFSQMDQFAISQTVSENTETPTRIKKVSNESDIEKLKDKDVLFLTNFYTKPHDLLYNYCLEHKTFQQKLRAHFAPSSSTPPMLTLPTDIITVALHIRKGSKFDTQLSSVQEYLDQREIIQYTKSKQQLPVHSKECKTASSAMDRRYPLKFPPNQYYIDAIHKLSELYNHQPLYIHLFTDHYNPEALLKKIKQAVNRDTITWATRSNRQKQETTILDDFFAMTHFKCLIRGDSSFSKVVQLLGNFQTIIYPINGVWMHDKLLIDSVGIIFHEKTVF